MKLTGLWYVVNCHTGYNSLENPIGIETPARMKERTAGVIGYNSLENPIGIETVTWQYEIRDGKKLQLIRKPDRD